MQNTDQQKPTTATDSLFGMMLATAFIGVAYGAGAETAFKSIETASDIYDDRRPAFKLGDKNSLGGIFTRQSAEDWKAPQPFMMMKAPSCAPSIRF